jgi:tripartite-type tricarboxylate transporter receptor subunit TctC
MKSQWKRIGAIAAIMAGMTHAAAQEFPNKPVRIIVAGSPGTAPDIVARMVGNEMPKFLGQAVIIENRPGAAEIVGYEYVAKQVPADGYTVALGTVSSLALMPVITRELRFDPLKDLPPVIGLTEGRLILTTPVGTPWKTFKEMIEHVKAAPGKYNFGAGTPSSRFPMLITMQQLGLDIVFIPYSTGGPYVQGLLVGDVQMGFLGMNSGITYKDKLRVLAVTGSERRAPYQDVPTFSELGLPQIHGLSHMLNVPVGTPRGAMDKLAAAASQAAKQPGAQGQLEKLGIDILLRSSEEVNRYFQDEARSYAESAKRAGVRAE